MAIDNTPPRLKLIITIAVITIVTLIGIDFVLKSYYAMMTDEAAHEKIAPTTDKENQHKAEDVALTAANIDGAMKSLAGGTRPDAITPQPSEDMGPMTGWTKLPKQAPTPMAPPRTDAPTDALDAGAMTTTGDAGRGNGLTMDGGMMIPRNERRESRDGGARH